MLAVEILLWSAAPDNSIGSRCGAEHADDSWYTLNVYSVNP